MNSRPLRRYLAAIALFGAHLIAAAHSQEEATFPNIVYILADDMGYGDVQCLNPERGKIPTPHMDAVAREGMTFTDAHTSSSVCTPTRYSVLTGRYHWRTHLQKGVLNGYGLPLIAAERTTVPSFLKEHGYTTAMIGKWHLGLDIPTTDGKDARAKNVSGERNVEVDPASISNIDWNGTIKGGPVNLGFDSWYGISASLDFPPYVWIRDNKFAGAGTQIKAFRRNGPADRDFEAIDVLDEFARETAEFITDYKEDAPFFIYMPLTSPHTPIVPSGKWQGKSPLGPYGDFMMQTDDVVGQVIAALDAKGLSENTLVIVTSDNGCSRAARIDDLEEQGHFPSAQFRGSKADLWEGGHRVPFLVKWPAVIKSGTLSHTLTCQTDLLATCAEIVNARLPGNSGEDSVSILPAFRGQEITTSRKGIVNHSVSGHFAYREGDWKLLLAHGSGGWTAPDEAAARKAGLPIAQLYHLADDPGETNNLYESNPEKAQALLDQLTTYVHSGRSTGGPESSNDIPSEDIILWKSEKR